MVGGDRWCAFKSRSQPVIYGASCPHIMPSLSTLHCLPCSASWEFQQKVEEQLHSFSSQASAFIVTSWWEVIAGVPSNPGAWFAFCPSCAFQHCTSTWVLFAKYFKHSMLSLVALPTQDSTNLSLRCFSRKSKNNCILFPVRLVPSLLHDRWCAFKSRSQPVI